jgi:hypothetical protein
MGWTVADAETVIKDQREFERLVILARSAWPDAFSESVFAGTPGGTSVIHFKDDVPSDAWDLVAAANFPLDLLPGAQFNESELVKDVQLATNHLDAAGYEVFAVSYNDGHLDVALEEGVSDPGLAGVVTVPVVITYGSDPAILDNAGRGGARTGADCMSAFTIRRPATGVVGVAQSGHCARSTLDNEDGTAIVTINSAANHMGAFGDFSWGVTPGVPDDIAFWARPLPNSNWVQRYTQSSVKADFSRGDWTCGFGRASVQPSVVRPAIRRCARVTSRVATLRTRQFPVFREQVKANDQVAISGDSGGPWSLGGRVHGVHSGRVWRNRAVFSRFYHLENLFSVELLTP